MPHVWPEDLRFTDLRLKILDRDCRTCDGKTYVADYKHIKSLLSSIDGLQPEKGHEALYTVRELNGNRLWFARPLLSRSEAEVEKLFVEAREWAEMLGKPGTPSA